MGNGFFQLVMCMRYKRRRIVLELITVHNMQEQYYLSKIVVNPDFISVVKEFSEYDNALREGKMNLNFDQAVRFSEITMSGRGGFEKYIVVGSPMQIKEKLNRGKIQLLKD
jgi:hypothetical protein